MTQKMYRVIAPLILTIENKGICFHQNFAVDDEFVFDTDKPKVMNFEGLWLESPEAEGFDINWMLVRNIKEIELKEKIKYEEPKQEQNNDEVLNKILNVLLDIRDILKREQ